MRGIYFFIAILFFSPEIFAQNKFNLIGGVIIADNHYSYAQHKNVLVTQSKQDGLILIDGSGQLQYRPHRKTSFEIGFMFLEMGNDCEDTAYLKRNPANRSLMLDKRQFNVLAYDIYYKSFFATMTRYIPISSTGSFYFSGGITNNYLRGPTGITKTFFDNKNNETLQLNYHFIRNFFGVSTEIGWNSILFNGRSTLYFGYRYSRGIKKVVTGDYTDMQNNVMINTDHLNTHGSHFGVFIRLGVNLNWSIASKHGRHSKSKGTKVKKESSLNKSHKEKSPKQIDTKAGKEKIKKEESKQNSIPLNTLPKKLKNREVKIKKELTANSRVATIRVWDYDKIDGDIISLYLNGELILGKYTLTKEHYEIKIELKPGINYLVLHSISMGKDVPCTSAMIIDDGRSQQEVILNSTPQSSDGIKIKLEE